MNKSQSAECGNYEESIQGLSMLVNKFTSKVIVDSKELIRFCLCCVDKDKCDKKNNFITHLDKNA